MRLILLFITSAFITCNAQNITIKGKAHASHIGKEIVLNDFTDYITYNLIKESADTIDKDGYFELKLQSNITRPVLININNLVGKIYVQPNFVYGIYFPPKDSLTNNQEGTQTTVDISVYGKDSTELNALIVDFNTQYNNLFLNIKVGYLSPAKLNIMLDTFLVSTKKRYSHIKNPYFKNYVDYSFADFFSSTSRNKTILYKKFIDRRPLQYSNYEYMQFFNIHFKGYLKAFSSTKNGGNIYNSINAFADYRDLKNQLKEDKSISNDTLRELLILKGLIDFYYSPEFDKKQVQSVIEQIYRETNIREHKSIAFNMLQTINQLQPGAPAPDFVVNDKDGMKVNLSNYKGKYIYLNFFSSESETSQKEMQKIIDLKKKFKDKITFISVCLDDSVTTYRTYLKTNPKQDWIILHQAPNSSAKKAYNIKTLSGFYFINPQMQLAQSPALMPSEGIEYKFNALFRPRKKNTIPGVR
ncbi:MAG: TlpA family protein disulfide reductase [Burkholderiales bacterium]|nr:TlpA family protein disulfide reductase [Bacteroidia bacterium]